MTDPSPTGPNATTASLEQLINKALKHRMLEAEFYALLERVKKTCALYRIPRGSPKQYAKESLIIDVIQCFEAVTGKKAKATPTGVFDEFISLVLADISDGEGEGKSHRKLIESALASVRRMPSR